ncbi:MAG: hypothetical protein FJX45_18090 [Alphaproteobacteria bacterium]|nr:hypothetical protein [Alphaproteobacteria bacterium]
MKPFVTANSHPPLANRVAQQGGAGCDDARAFDAAVRDALGFTRAFFLIEAGPRAVMLDCRAAVPRSPAERDRLAALHAWASRRAEREPHARRLNY